MKSQALSAIASASLLASAIAADVDPIVIKGNKFFMQNSGQQFYIKGVAYQQGVGTSGSVLGKGGSFTDPLANPSACKRDIPYLKQLDTNTIRVYAIDPTKNHDECMSMLQDAGIYVLSDLSQPDESINRASPSWDDALFTRYASVIDTMQKYKNVIGFFAGNEVSNSPTTTEASAFVKAAVRDMKAYIKANNYRAMGVGYATSDDTSIRVKLPEYMDCGSEEDSIDFWGYNIYEWCSPSDTFQSSGYQDRTEQFKNFNKPAFFAEYGCIDPGPRLFTDTPVIYGPLMNDVWSGGIVYMYFEEANNFGLVKVNGDKVQPINPDFSALSSQIRKATATGVQMGSFTPTNSPAACPPVNAAWQATASPLPPPPSQQACGCMMDTLSCKIKSSTPLSKYAGIFKFVCDPKNGDANACVGISTNAKTGEYGAYSMCSAEEKISWVMNHYVNTAQQAVCNFQGAAESVTPSSASDQCKKLNAQAGPNGQGTVKESPVAAGTTQASPGSGSGSGGTNAGAAVTVPSLDMFGLMKMGLYVFFAFFTGVGMMLL